MKRVLMKFVIPVSDEVEAQAVRRGLEDHNVRAAVVILGTLVELPTDADRREVLVYIRDRLAEAVAAAEADRLRVTL